MTVQIELLSCKQVRPYRRAATIRLRLFDDASEVLTQDYTEPLGDMAAVSSLTNRLRMRMQTTIDRYKADQAFLQTTEMNQVVIDLQGALKV